MEGAYLGRKISAYANRAKDLNGFGVSTSISDPFRLAVPGEKNTSRLAH